MEIRVCRDGMMIGSYSLEEAQRALDAGALFANDLSWYPGAPCWGPLCDVPGIRVTNDADAASADDSPANDEPPPLPPKPLRVAGFWLRLASGLLDSVFVSLISELLLEIFAHEKMAALVKTATGLMNLYMQNLQSPDLENIIQAQHLTVLLIQQSMPLLWLSLGIMWLYFAGLNALPWQTTPGKWLLKLKLVETNGSRVGFWRATIRFIGSVIFIGYLLLPFSRKKQSLQDMIVGALVVHR